MDKPPEVVGERGAGGIAGGVGNAVVVCVESLETRLREGGVGKGFPE